MKEGKENAGLRRGERGKCPMAPLPLPPTPLSGILTAQGCSVP